MYKLFYKYSGDLYEISDYIESIKGVSYISRNPDYTLLADGYKFEVPPTYVSASRLTVDIPIYLYSESVLIHNGKIEEKTYDYDKRIHMIQVRHALTDLKDVVNDKDSLDDIISYYSESVNVYSFDYDLITHNNLIEAYFSASNYQLDWSTHYVSQSSVVITTSGSLSSIVSTQIVSPWNNVYYIPEAMYCLNQPKVWSPLWLKYNDGDSSSVDPNTAGEERMISTWDTLSILSSFFGYNYIPKDTGSFYVISYNADPVDPTPVISNDERYAYDEKIYKGKSGVKVTFNALTLWTGQANLGANAINNRWFPSAIKQGYYIEDTASFQGRTTDNAGREVIYANSYAFGSKGSSLKWYDHLVPVFISGSLPHLIYPAVANQNTIVKHQRGAIYNGGIERTVETLSSNAWNQTHLFAIQELVFKDFKKDLIEITWRVEF